MPSSTIAAAGDERDSRPLIGAGSSSSSAAAPGSSGWRNLQKVDGSELQPPSQLGSHGWIPEEGPGSPDPSFTRFNSGEAFTEPPPEHEGSGLPLLQATLSRAQRLCLAQSGLSLAVVACAAVLVEPSWPRWLLLAGLALAVGVLGRVQLRGLGYEALSARLQAAPPTYLLINTAQPPLMQARHINTHSTARAGTQHATCTPCASAASSRADTHGIRAPPEQLGIGYRLLRAMRVPRVRAIHARAHMHGSCSLR